MWWYEVKGKGAEGVDSRVVDRRISRQPERKQPMRGFQAAALFDVCLDQRFSRGRTLIPHLLLRTLTPPAQLVLNASSTPSLTIRNISPFDPARHISPLSTMPQVNPRSSTVSRLPPLPASSPSPTCLHPPSPLQPKYTTSPASSPAASHPTATSHVSPPPHALPSRRFRPQIPPRPSVPWHRVISSSGAIADRGDGARRLLGRRKDFRRKG